MIIGTNRSVTNIMLYVLLFFAALLVRIHGSVTGYIEPSDSKRFLEVLVTNFVNQESDDVILPYYGAVGFNLLEAPIVQVLTKDNCEKLKVHFKPESSPEAVFYAVTSFSLLKCPGKLYTDKTVTNLRQILENDKSTPADIRYAVETLTLIGQNIPNPTKASQILQAKIKEDESLQSIGHALHAAALFGNAGKFALDRVNDIISQADEIDGKLLQWEGGLTTTSLILTGLLRLPNAKLLTQIQADKFGSYLLSRKSVQSSKGIVALLQAAKALSDSAVSPVSISVIESAQVTREKPDLHVRISDLFGRPLKTPPTPVVAQSATRVVDDVVVLSKQPLTQSSNASEYVLKLQLEPGQYRIDLSAGSQSTALNVRALGSVTLNWLEIGVGDVDGTTAPRLSRLQYPAKLSTTLQSDSSQHLIARISLGRVVHQAFLRLYSGNKEIIFVAEPDSNQLYKLEVNLAAELEYSDTYELELIIGDFLINNPIRWKIGSLEAKLGTPAPAEKKTKGLKPEIKHLFRPAEKRPPQTVSILFTALAAAPLLLLFVLWAKLSINFGNFTFIAIPFHVGLGSILGLFTLFWLKLDMFATCAWLIPLGSFTFLAGHRLLSRIANQKKSDK